jgi:ATP-dependent Lon protease
MEPFTKTSPSKFADAFSFFLPLTLEEKMKMIGEADVVKRLKHLKSKIGELSGLAPIDDEEETDELNIKNEVNKKVNDKLHKQQREFMLREQLKQIEEELGEITGEENDANSLLDKVNKDPYPKSVKKKLRKEINRLKATPSASVEYGIIRSYIDTIMEVP